jgi:hypothetical protein
MSKAQEVEVGTEDKMKPYDDAAIEAAKEYNPKGTAGDTATWIEKWQGKAGYKRLVRVIRAAHKK